MKIKFVLTHAFVMLITLATGFTAHIRVRQLQSIADFTTAESRFVMTLARRTDKRKAGPDSPQGSAIKKHASSQVQSDVRSQSPMDRQPSTNSIGTANRRIEQPEGGRPAQTVRPERSISPSPRPASSNKQSDSSWSGHGFTTSGSPSSWGSRYEADRQRPVTSMVVARGPAIVRLRTKKEGRRTFLDIPNKKVFSNSITDPSKSQVAVHIRKNEGHASVVGTALDTSVTVDARKSLQGGAISKVDRFGRKTTITEVPAGQKAKYMYFNDREVVQGVEASIRGKGTIKAYSSNAFTSDIDDSDSGNSGSSRSSGSSQNSERSSDRTGSVQSLK